jgi:hypothetical protein
VAFSAPLTWLMVCLENRCLVGESTKKKAKRIVFFTFGGIDGKFVAENA